MKHYLLLCREGVELAAEPVEITVDYGSAPLRRALEYGMFDKMGDTVVVAHFISRTAFYAQGAICYGRVAFPDCVLQPAGCPSAYHYFFLGAVTLFTSSARKPAPNFLDILCLRK